MPIRSTLLSGALLAVLLLDAVMASAQGFKWWQVDRFQEELALTDEQVARLEETFQALAPALKTQKEALDRLESRLSKILNDPRADEAQVLQMVERVEAARGELSKSRTLLAFRHGRILTSDQNVKLRALHHQWVRERRPRPSPPSRR